MLNATTSQKYLLAASLWSQSKQFSDFRSGLSSALDQQLDRVSWRQDLQEVSEVPKIIFPPKMWSSGCPTGPGRPACDYSRKYCSICAFYSIFAFWSCKSHRWWMQNTLWTWDSNLIHEEPQCNQLQLADSISSLHLVCLVEQLNQGADATADNASAKATQIVTWNRRIWVKGVAMGFNEVSVTFIKQNSWCHLLCQIQFHWIRNSRFQWCY